MPNFQESNVAGTVYTRSYKVVIDNALDTNPAIHFSQEQIANLGAEERFQKLVSSVSETLTSDNASTTFDLIHPATGSAIGQATYEQFQLMLYSLYLYVAQRPTITVELPLQEASVV